MATLICILASFSLNALELLNFELLLESLEEQFYLASVLFFLFSNILKRLKGRHIHYQELAIWKLAIGCT